MQQIKPTRVETVEGNTAALIDVPDGMLTVPELAHRLRVPPSWVYGHADALGVYRVGKYLRFDWDRVLARLRAGKTGSGKLGSQPNDLPDKP